jgi:LytS/YehU family sensor histidine kinase
MSIFLIPAINKFKNIFFKILLKFFVTILVTFLISYIFLEIWNWLFHHNSYSYSHLLIVQLILTFISILVSSIYEIIYLNKEKEYNLIKVERSEKLKIQAQLDALKSQIDPHFLFNSLNTLSYLISIDPGKAKLFNDTLAKVYRYILINKEKDMVQLKEEIEFASHNYYLLRIRYPEGLKLQIDLHNIITENYLIPPLSLQTLIENAIKHNQFSEKDPLLIDVSVTGESVNVTNNKRLKKFQVVSSKIGLLNLNERYKLIVNKSITIEEGNERFSVFLPIINC